MILVVDDMAIIRESITASLRAAGYPTSGADNGREALAKIRSECPKLLVLDLSMPGMDGLSLLRALRSDPVTAGIAVILLTASSERAQIVEAGKLGVRDYLLKTAFSISDLLARVRKYLPCPDTTSPAPAVRTSVAVAAASPAIVKLSRAEAQRRIAHAQIKPLPSAVTKLMTLASSPRGTVADAAQFLKHDPALSACVLRVANSAAFASSRSRIFSIEDAVKHIGLAEVLNLATSVGVFETITGEGQHDDLLLRIWQHSLAVAELMEMLARHEGSHSPESAYVVGLCHDLPEILLRQHLPEQFRYCIDEAAKTGRSHHAMATEVFGMPLIELMTLLLDRLGLPSTITSPIREFFGGQGAGSTMHHPLSRMLALADLCSHGMLLVSNLDEPLRPLSITECREVLGSTMPRLDFAVARGDAILNFAAFSTASGTTMSHLAESPLPRQLLHVLYIRDEKYAELDPLHAALEMLTDHVTLRITGGESPAKTDHPDRIVIAAQTRSVANTEIAWAQKHVGGQVPILSLHAETGKLDRVGTGLTSKRLPISIHDLGEFVGLTSEPSNACAA